jgi:transposase
MTLQKPVEALQIENTNLRKEIQYLREQLEWLKRQVFGQRSEKIISKNEEVLFFPGLDLPSKPTTPETETVPAHTRRKPNRNGKDAIDLPENLPVEKHVIDIPESEKVCKETGAPLVKIGEEVTQKIAHKPGSYYIKEIIRPKYAAPKNPDAGIITAELPETLLPRCQADESFLADICVKKFADHLPLYRQCEILSRENIYISRQILCQWVVRAGLALKPLQTEMLKSILETKNAFIDEVPIDMLAPGNGKVKKAFMWVLAGGLHKDPPYRVYEFYENRKHSNAAEILKGYTGVLHSDKYGAYEALANTKQFTWCPCWAHIRRKFFEAEAGDPVFRAWVLRKIRYLFLLEQVAWARSSEERLRIRKEKEIPIIDELITAVKGRLTDGKLLPKSKFKEALGYFCSLIPYIKNYTLFPFARLDNNVAERAVRPLAIGRKNWMFIGNEDGGEAAAVLCSLIQTCRGLGINPREYLEDLMRRIMSHPANKLRELLPDQWAASRKLLRCKSSD